MVRRPWSVGMVCVVVSGGVCGDASAQSGQGGSDRGGDGESGWVQWAGHVAHPREVAEDLAVLFGDPRFAMGSALISLPVYGQVFLVGEIELVDGRLAVPRLDSARGTHLSRGVRQIEKREDLIDGLIDQALQPACDLDHLASLIGADGGEARGVVAMYRQGYRWLRGEAMRAAVVGDEDRFAECVAGIIGLCAQLGVRAEMSHCLTIGAMLNSLVAREGRVPSGFQVALEVLEGEDARLVVSALDRLDLREPVSMRAAWVSASLERIAGADDSEGVGLLVEEIDRAWESRDEAALARAHRALVEASGGGEDLPEVRGLLEMVQQDWHRARALARLRAGLAEQG